MGELYINRYKNKKGVKRVSIIGELGDLSEAGFEDRLDNRYTNKQGVVKATLMDASELDVESALDWNEKQVADEKKRDQDGVQGWCAYHLAPKPVMKLTGIGVDVIMDGLAGWEGRVRVSDLRRDMGLTNDEAKALHRLMVIDGWLDEKSKMTLDGNREAGKVAVWADQQIEMLKEDEDVDGYWG